MNLFLSAIGCAGCLAAGLGVQHRLRRREKIFTAAEKTVGEILLLLQSGDGDTMTVLSLVQKEVLPCIGQTVDAVRNGADLSAAWAESLAAFCEKNSLSQMEKHCLNELIAPLGSMTLSAQIEHYRSMRQTFVQMKEQAAEKRQKDGNLAVKIGLLCGLGIGLLLWKP